MKINRNGIDYELKVDVLDELNFYDWSRVRVKPDEMVACSPFRNEKSPSFSINLETGLWIDFGSHDDFYKKGNLITLLSFLRNETPNEVESYLLSKYGIDLSDVDSLSIDIDFSIDTKEEPIIDIDTYKQYAFKHPYLNRRGISDKVQRAFKIGFDKKSNAIALAWFDVDGNIINIKFRSVKSKIFYYYPNGQPIRNHIYGMHFVFKMKSETVYLVESEIDALYMWSNGFPAIALGGSNISEAQKKLILRSPIKTLVMATDNDAVGQEIRDKVSRAFMGTKEIREINLPVGVKDVNDLSPERLKQVANNTIPVTFSIFNTKPNR